MKLSKHDVLKVSNWMRPQAKVAPMLETPPDLTQFPTRLVYPDLTQLQTMPSSPKSYPPKILPGKLLPASDEVSLPVEERSSTIDRFQETTHSQSRLLLYIRIVLLLLSHLAIPLLLYALLEDYGFHITRILYYGVSIVLIVNAYSTIVQTFFGLRTAKIPEKIAVSYPSATAIITAYLPNEKATIVETIKSMLDMTYPGPLQVILAYNTPYKLPVERVLQEIALHDQRLVLLHVKCSNSKAENISYALRKVTGTFVGIFDADHFPAPDAFKRAWHWLSKEYDIVQGRCVVRNGERSWITRLVAVEFELLYGLEYLAHTRIRHFGIFRGANGYWRTNVLRKIDMDSITFAESIDSSLKALEQGYRIMHDPLLICRELAPETLQDFWNQRVRQAQGLFQVSLKHLWTCLSSSQLSLRQKFGCFNFLIGREVSAWFTAQIIPLFILQVMHEGWPLLASSFLGCTAVIVSTSLLQILLTYSTALPEIRRHFVWFFSYAVLSLLLFAEIKNCITYVALLKELSGRRDWNVTPRSNFHTKKG